MNRLAALALAALILTACGGDDPAPPVDDVSEEPADTGNGDGGDSGKPDAGPPPDPSTYGSITGAVLFEGKPPALREFNLAGLAFCDKCHPDAKLPTEDYLIQDGKIEGVFVYIRKGLHKDLEWPVPEEPVVFDQVGCVFVPHTLGVRVGQTVVVNNSDGVGHNVNGHPQRNSNFNFSMPAHEKGREIDFRRAEVPVRVTCDIHPHMSAYIAVFDHPFFAVTGPDGSFNFAGVPPGEYEMRAVHEKLGTLDATVTLDANGNASQNFTFKAK